MLTARLETYDRYLAAWSAIPDNERETLLRATLSDGITFENPQQTRRGIADMIVHLEGFQRRTPGGAFRMNTMIGWGDQALAEWQLIDAAGKPRFSGHDVLTFDPSSRISHILLFANVEAQKLVWRRRDPAKLSVTP